MSPWIRGICGFRTPGRGCFIGLAFVATALAASEELLNFRLSPDYAAFLVGPLGKIATPQEREAFLKLTNDEAAQAFVEQFWAARDPDPGTPGNPVRELAERRIAEADRRFREGAALGHRTDRGVIFVLYGEPQRIDYEPGEDPGEPPREVWTYGPNAPKGLDGKKPERQYRFVELDGRYVTYLPGLRRPRRALEPAWPPMF
jgi:GWxTD domain-containing protein